MTKEWIKGILSGDKKLMKLKNLKTVNVGFYPEVSVKNLYDDYSSRADVKPYLPDKLPVGKQMDKEYFFNIVNTLYEEELQMMMQYANS